MALRRIKTVLCAVLSVIMGCFFMFAGIGCKDENGDPMKKYEVTFDYNDGSGRTHVEQVPKGYTIDAYAPTVVEGNKEIVAWSLTDGGTHYSGEVTSDLTLLGVWQEHEVVEYKTSVPDTITDRFAQITLKAASTDSGENGENGASDQSTGANVALLAGKTLRIGAGCISLTIVSDGTAVQELSILVNERTEDLFLYFNNFAYTSKAGCGLNARNDNANIPYTLHLDLKGANGIDCSGAASETEDRGADGIRAHELNITGTGSLAVIAGNGVAGKPGATAGEGQDGNDGAAGQAGGVGIVADSVALGACKLTVQGGNGGNGGNGSAGNNTDGFSLSPSGKIKDGGNGAPGGNGGAAIDTSAFNATNSTLILTGGNGGNGGAGGSAGGSNALTAGKGGNGGNGGAGGSIFATSITPTKAKTSDTFTIGVGGNGGSAGFSYDNAVLGIGGAKGADGVTNINE